MFLLLLTLILPLWVKRCGLSVYIFVPIMMEIQDLLNSIVFYQIVILIFITDFFEPTSNKLKKNTILPLDTSLLLWELARHQCIDHSLPYRGKRLGGWHPQTQLHHVRQMAGKVRARDAPPLYVDIDNLFIQTLRPTHAKVWLD